MDAIEECGVDLEKERVFILFLKNMIKETEFRE